jgi:hypothetical protein
VREVLHKWLHLGREGLWELPGRGGKPSWKEEDIEFLAECLKKEPRTYNSLQLAQKLEKERSIKRASRSIKTDTKKKGLFGNERGRVTKENKKPQYEKLSKMT